MQQGALSRTIWSLYVYLAACSHSSQVEHRFEKSWEGGSRRESSVFWTRERRVISVQTPRGPKRSLAHTQAQRRGNEERGPRWRQRKLVYLGRGYKLGSDRHAIRVPANTRFLSNVASLSLWFSVPPRSVNLPSLSSSASFGWSSYEEKTKKRRRDRPPRCTFA